MVQNVCDKSRFDELKKIKFIHQEVISNLSPEKQAVTVIWIVIFILGFFGNLVVIFTLLNENEIRKKSSTVFTLNLAIANLLFICFCPLAISRRIALSWKFGRFVCRLILLRCCLDYGLY